MSVWEDEAAPVLRSIASAQGGRLADGILMLGHGRGGEALGLEMDDAVIHRAILLLLDEDYIEAHAEYETGPGAILTGLRVTGRGQQALGEWPRFELLTTPSTLALMLEHLSEQAGSEEDRSVLRRAAGYVRGLSKESVRGAIVRAGVIITRQQLGI